jgi:hypothetical protein
MAGIVHSGGKMASFNVYLTEELSARMKKFKEEKWAEVATRAFERRLIELGAMKGLRTGEQLALDLFIAEKLFGWKPEITNGQVTGFTDENKDHRKLDEAPFFSSDLKELDGLIRAASKKKIGFSIQDPAVGQGKLVLGFTKGKLPSMSSPETDDQVPEAVCKVLRDLLT